MAGLCEGDNEPAGSLKAICNISAARGASYTQSLRKVGWWEVVGGGKEVTARRGDKSARLLQLFVVLSLFLLYSLLSLPFLPLRLVLILLHMHTHKSVPFLRVGPQLDYKKELRKGLVKCFVWSVALYGAETWTLRRSEEKRIEAFELWIWRRMERVKWTHRIKNEAVLERVVEERMMLKLIRKRKRNWLGHWLRRNCLLKNVLEGMVNGRRVRSRRRYQMIDDIKI
ncbi:hypothetical protein ANN_06749 [Periplaneta americana]|uniref:Uncharacterized protein n=1 Tax=Periplaneta americana TaxID=6978 RepID=A0ABQ8TGG0_PERAM|nr:hypothetical protein ANN_06749 [Periplaneta americana]